VVQCGRQMALTSLWLHGSKLTVCKHEVVTFLLGCSLYVHILGVNVINCSAMFVSLSLSAVIYCLFLKMYVDVAVKM